MWRHFVTFTFGFSLFTATAILCGGRLSPTAAAKDARLKPGQTHGSAPPPVRSMAMTKDDWLKAQSNHFTLIGDASEKDIRNAGMRLEQFREAFSQIISQIIS